MNFDEIETGPVWHRTATRPVRTLIKNSELALKNLEGSFSNSDAQQPCELQLFRFEELTTKKERQGRRFRFDFGRRTCPIDSVSISFFGSSASLDCWA